jgi:hypothetical protein
MEEETARIVAIAEANRLGLRYFWVMGAVILVLGAGAFTGLLSGPAVAQWAGVTVLGFFAAGLFFTYALSAPLFGSPWAWCLASVALCFTGFGPVLLVAYLTYQAQQELLKAGLDPASRGISVDDLAKWAARREGGLPPL